MYQAESASKSEVAGYLKQQAKEYTNRAANCGLITLLLAAGYAGTNELSKTECVENQSDAGAITCARYEHSASPSAWDSDYTKLLFGFPAGVLAVTGISNGLKARRANVMIKQIEAQANTKSS
jgi:hypothetical protein